MADCPRVNWVAVIGALEETSYHSPVVFEWAGTYWSKNDFAEIARGIHFNWRHFEALAEAAKGG